MSHPDPRNGSGWGSRRARLADIPAFIAPSRRVAPGDPAGEVPVLVLVHPSAGSRQHLGEHSVTNRRGNLLEGARHGNTADNVRGTDIGVRNDVLGRDRVGSNQRFAHRRGVGGCCYYG